MQGNANIITNAYFSVEHVNLDSGSTTKEGYVVDVGLGAVPVNIQPSSPDVSLLYGGAFGKMYTVFTTNSGILETDRLTTVSGTSSTKYIVKGKQYFNYGMGQHTELYVEQIL